MNWGQVYSFRGADGGPVGSNKGSVRHVVLPACDIKDTSFDRLPADFKGNICQEGLDDLASLVGGRFGSRAYDAVSQATEELIASRIDAFHLENINWHALALRRGPAGLWVLTWGTPC